MNNKPRVLITYHSAEYGGVEFHILDIIKGLSSDFDIFIACPEGPLVKEYLSAGAVEHIHLAPKREIDFEYIAKLRIIIKEESISIVHSHELRAGVQTMYAAFQEKVNKRIYHVHTPFIFWQHSGTKKYFALVANWIANFVAGNFFATDIIALTPYIKKVRSKYELISQSKIRVIPNAVKLNPEISNEYIESVKSEYQIDKAKIVLGYVARFTKEKGHEILLEAFNSSKNLQEKCQLVLVGNGVLFDELKTKYKSNQSIIFTNQVEDNKKSALFSIFDIFVFPTLAEGFGISLIEALSYGLPCLVSDLPVLHDVGGDSAFYFKTGDIKDLQDKLSKIIADLSDIKLLADNRKQVAKLYSLENFWNNYKELYLS